jgi:hypothetical protein
MSYKSRLYDVLYEMADKVLKEHNPCRVENGKCLRCQKGGHNFCCDDCQYLKDNGCSVKALYCRVWLCGSHHRGIVENELNFIHYIARQHGLLTFRGSKEDSI